MREVWRPVHGYQGYEASNLGRLRSWRCKGPVKPREMRQCVGHFGYRYVSLSPRPGVKANPKAVHVCVLLAFRGPRPAGLWCRHLNGDPTDNRLANLRWGTPKQNSADRERHGRTARGDRSGARLHPERMPRGDAHWSRRNPNAASIYRRGSQVNTAKLTEEDVRAIRAASGMQREIAVAFGVNVTTVQAILHRRTWRHVE